MTDDWYITIIRFPENTHYPFSAPCSGYYRNFKEIVAKGIGQLIAEVFNVQGDVLDSISESGKLRDLANRLNDREKFDVQKELEEMCGVTSVGGE